MIWLMAINFFTNYNNNNVKLHEEMTTLKKLKRLAEMQ